MSVRSRAGYDADGKRVRRTVTGRTRAEVRDKLKQLHDELKQGSPGSPIHAVRQAVADWLDSLDLDPATVANYAQMSKHVTGRLGRKRLRDLTASDVQSFLEGLELSTTLNHRG